MVRMLFLCSRNHMRIAMPEIYIGPIALEDLFSFDTRAEDSACPYTFLAFPTQLVGEHGIPTNPDAEAYIAAVQSEGVPVGIWTRSPVEGTAYAAVDQEQISSLHEAIKRLTGRGQFTSEFAEELCERLFQSERSE